MKVARYSAFRLCTGEESFVLCADEGSSPAHRRSPVHRRFGVGGKSALGPRNAPCEVESVRRLPRQRSAAYGGRAARVIKSVRTMRTGRVDALLDGQSCGGGSADEETRNGQTGRRRLTTVNAFRASAAPRTEFACAQANACAQEDVQVPRRRRIRRGSCLRTGRS